MADILTQIQDELDMLLNQMQSSLAYIRVRAPPAAIPNQPLLSTFAEHEAQSAAAQAASQPNSNPSQAAPPPPPPSPEEFQKDVRELSRDLYLKEQQIEVLIASLPGLDTSEKEQVERMRELERELEGLEGERVRAVREKEGLVTLVEERIRSARSVR
ncbi:CSE2-domain-containing protein [Byssothecium circinans]|uniref:Mediator of RNA polymerase II transcription subunit 21 n=1 Tax=Byssothecium circinans TaxID=147558 RepID=A0A6A5T9Z3_9PLEO|nr:CSE2-domain-containing protein [Byssothecium circinans]